MSEHSHFPLHSVALIVGLIALACLVGLLLSWKMPDSPARRWLFLLGIAVLPGLALFLGANTAIEEAKKPSFCASCHVMHPFTNNLIDPDSTTLASVHYQNRYILNNQCYTCHTDYTIFGPMKAKLAGVRHVWKDATGRYTTPIRLVSSYDFGNCLHCHGESRIFKQQHEDELLQLLDTQEAACLDCHGPAHPDQEEVP